MVARAKALAGEKVRGSSEHESSGRIERRFTSQEALIAVSKRRTGRPDFQGPVTLRPSITRGLPFAEGDPRKFRSKSSKRNAKNDGPIGAKTIPELTAPAAIYRECFLRTSRPRA
jgi:hypothetical protein